MSIMRTDDDFDPRYETIRSATLARRARMAARAVPDTEIDLRRKTIDGFLPAPPEKTAVAPEPAEQPSIKHPVTEPQDDEDTASIAMLREGRRPTHRAIRRATIAVMDPSITEAMIMSPCRNGPIVRLRHMAIFMSRTIYWHQGTKAIGCGYMYDHKHIGPKHRDHTTVLNSVNRVLDCLQAERTGTVYVINAILRHLSDHGWRVPTIFDDMVLPKRTRHPIVHPSGSSSQRTSP